MISRIILKTKMSSSAITETLSTINTIEDKVKNGQFIGNQADFNLDNDNNNIIKLLRGHTGDWTRLAPVLYTDLDYRYVKRSNILKNIDTWTRCNPQDPDAKLIKKDKINSFYLSDNSNSIFIDHIDKDYNYLREVYFKDMDMRHSKQPDNLLKFHLHKVSISNYFDKK